MNPATHLREKPVRDAGDDKEQRVDLVFERVVCECSSAEGCQLLFCEVLLDIACTVNVCGSILARLTFHGGTPWQTGSPKISSASARHSAALRRLYVRHLARLTSRNPR